MSTDPFFDNVGRIFPTTDITFGLAFCLFATISSGVAGLYCYYKYRQLVNKNKSCPDATHNPEPLIVAYRGAKYDLTHFLKYHPGGKEVLLKYEGLDIEQAMIENNHSANAYKQLAKCKIEAPCQ